MKEAITNKRAQQKRATQTRAEMEANVKQKQVNLFGMSGYGATLSEAKRAAGEKITRALDGYYTPEILRHGDEMILVTRDPFAGWQYAFIRETTGYVHATTSGNWSHDDCVRSAYHHLAQNAGHYAGIESKLSDSQRRDLDSYYKWQACYKACRAAGFDDENSRYISFGQLQLVNQKIDGIEPGAMVTK